MAQTEEEMRDLIKKTYSELNKLRKKKYKEHEGKCYWINGIYYYLERVLDKTFRVIISDNEGIRIEEMDVPIEQWEQYQITNQRMIDALQNQVDLFIKQVKEN